MTAIIEKAEYTVSRGYFMSEHEKREQIGQLVEEVSRLKGELNHVVEKLTLAFSAYGRLGQSPNGPLQWSVQGGTLVVPPSPNYANRPNIDFHALLNLHELIEVLEHKSKLTEELKIATGRLTGLVPHLF